LNKLPKHSFLGVGCFSFSFTPKPRIIKVLNSMRSSSLKSHTILNVVVRSGAIYAQILSVDEKGRQRILQTEDKYVFFEDIRTSEKYMEKITKTVESVVTKIVERLRVQNKVDVDYVAVFYSSPWFTSDLKRFDISPTEGQALFEKETMKEILEESARELKQEYKENEYLRPIEQHISNMNLNGYDLVDPYGKEYTTGVVTILTTWVSLAFQETLVQTLQSICQHKKILHFSFPYALIATLDYKTETRFCILDVHSEITDIIFMKDEVVESIQSIPVGTNHLLTAMNQKIFTSNQEKMNFLEMITKKYIDQQSAEVHKNICEAEVLRWYESLMNIPYFKSTYDYVILAEDPFKFLFEECLSREKSVYTHELSEEAEGGYVLKHAALFWDKYAKTHPEHLHRLQK